MTSTPATACVSPAKLKALTEPTIADFRFLEEDMNIALVVIIVIAVVLAIVGGLNAALNWLLWVALIVAVIAIIAFLFRVISGRNRT